MVATEIPANTEIPEYIVYAQSTGDLLNPEDRAAVKGALMDLMRPPVQAQEKSMDNALAQASASIDLSNLNISMQDGPSTEVRVASAASNIEKGHDGIA